MLIDLYRFFLEYLPALVVAVPVMVWLYREHRTSQAWRRVLIGISAVGACLALLFFIGQFPLTTRYPWSGGRLVPAVAWMKGYQLYYPAGEGPVFVQMYGPVSAMLYAFTAWVQRPTTAILLASACNLLIYLLPGLWVLVRCGRGRDPWMTRAGIVLFLLVSSRQFVLVNTATLVTIDAPAVGFFACAVALLAGGDSTRPLVKGLLCGLAAGLSIWTKLTLGPVVFALIAYTWLIHPRRDFLRFLAGFSLAIAGMSSLFLLWFGPELIFQNLVVPARQPWTRSTWDMSTAYARGMLELWQYCWPVNWMLLLAMIFHLTPAARTGDWRDWARQRPWLPLALAAVLVVPTATLAYVKIGGIWNNAAASAYFALLAATAALVSAGSARVTDVELLPRRCRVARAVLAIFLLAGFWVRLADVSELRSRLSIWADLRNNDHEVAWRYVKAHPGKVFLPGYPLSTLLADGRLDHFNAGIESMAWAGYPISEAHYRQFLPPQLEAIVFVPLGLPPYVWGPLTEFDTPTPVPELPSHWLAMTRDGVPP